MKLLACIGLGLLLWVGSVQAESDAEIVAARIKLLEAKLPKDHPRLLLRKSELPQFRAFVNALRADKEGAALWKKIAIEPGSIALPDEPEPLPAKKGANGADVAKLWRTGYERANDAGNTAWRFSLQYLATGDEKYGREAARWLMALADWRADKAALRNNDEQFIQATRPMIFAYDWAYDALMPAERIKLEQALISRLDLLKTDMDRLFSLVQPTPPNGSISHPMRFISTRGQGGLALFFEQQDAPAHLAWAYEYYNRQFPVWGGAAGGWAEGLDYWSSGLTQHLRFLEGMQLLGFNEPLKRPFFRHNAYFGMYNLMPYPGSSFGDLTNITGPNPNRGLLLEKYALLNHDPYPLAFAQQLASRYPDDLGYYTFNAIDTLLHRYRKNQAGLPAANLADLPQSRYFADIGWVSMHSQLGDKSNDIMLTLKSSPYGSASHSHNDQNAFVINAFGEPLAISSGYRDWYDSAHHVGWTRTTQSKNAILIDGKGQPSKDADAKGAIRHFYTGSNYTFASGDASAAYRNLAKSALRHVFFVNRRYFVMLDEVNANADSQFQWLLHAREAMRLDPSAGTVTSSKGQAALRVSFLAPSIDTLKFSQTDAFAVPLNAAFAKGRPNEWHVTVETMSPRRRGEFLTVLYPYRQGDSLPVAQALPVRQGFVASLEGKDERDVVLLAREAERWVDADAGRLQGLAASLSWRNGILVALTVVEAQSLQSDAVKLTAALPLTLSARMAETGWHLELQPGPAQEIRLRLPFAPQHVNGVAPGAWRYDVAQQELVLKLGDNVRLIDILK